MHEVRNCGHAFSMCGTVKHPTVRDCGYRQGADGVGSPSDYVTAQDAVHDVMERALELQSNLIRELRAEIARLRAGK
jgi:hypothetical protein